MTNLQLYEAFEQQLSAGRRKEAAQAITRFVQSFSGLDEKRQWTEAFLSGWKGSHKIRHELYEQVIFPALLDSYQRSELWGIRWLARTARNLYQASALWEQIDRKSEYQLLDQLLSITPHDAEARAELLAVQIDWLRHCGHEWPSGILYGNDGATLRQCAEIEQAVTKARALDLCRNYSAFLTEFEAKLDEYVSRLKAQEIGSIGNGSA